MYPGSVLDTVAVRSALTAASLAQIELGKSWLSANMSQSNRFKL